MKKPIIKKLALDSGRSALDHVTSDATPTLSGTAAAGATITILDKGKTIGTAHANAAGNWSFTAKHLPDGAHSFVAKATLGAQPVAVSSVFAAKIDTKAPAKPSGLALTSASDTGISATDHLTNDTTPTFSGNAEANALVTIRDGATVVGTGIANSAGHWTVTVSPLGDGGHTLRATATDVAGNQSALSALLAIQVDTAAQTPIIVTFSDDTGAADGITSDTQLHLAGTAAPNSTIDILDGTTVIGSGVIVDGSGDWQFDTPVLGEGGHDLTARASDAAGNVATSTLAVIVDTVTPTVAISGYSDDTGDPGDGLTGDDTLHLTGTTEAGASVEVFDGAASLGTVTAGVGGAWSFDTAALTPGAHSFTAQATDGAGHASPVSAALDVAVQRVIHLATLSAGQGFIIQGDAANDQAGTSVASAGDVNGDGFADVIVGAPNAFDYGHDVGKAYVVYGSSAGFGVVDLSTLSASHGITLRDSNIDVEAGGSVASAGDVNGDGIADFMVGAWGYNSDTRSAANDNTGKAYVVFGKAGGLTSAFLVQAVGNGKGLSIIGDLGGDRAGWSVSSAGDVNGDGFADMIVGAPRNLAGGTFAGEAYVVFGKSSGLSSIDVDSLSAAQGFVIRGAISNGGVGISVSSAGDVNGDGFDDIVVGAPYSSDGGNTFVIFGTNAGFGAPSGARKVVDLGASLGSTGFIIHGDSGDGLGHSVASAGDVNGDGFGDLIIGASGKSPAGESYVIFGKPSGFADVDPTFLPATNGFVIRGDASFDQSGHSVSQAGDVNGDGFDDLIVGTHRGPTQVGKAYVIFGKASGFGTLDNGRDVIDLTNLTAADGFVIVGESGGDYAGNSVSAAGDVNGDGFADLIVGAPFGDAGGNASGQAYVIYGGAFGGASTPVNHLVGNAIAEQIIGGRGADTLVGGGGLDVIRAGAGNDSISVPDLAFRAIDGGGGTDTLAFTGGGHTFDFSTLADNKVKGIEAFDITGSGDNTLVIGALDAFHFSDTPNRVFTGAHSHNNTLVVHGNTGDTLDLNGYDPDGPGGADAYAWVKVADHVNLDGSNAGSGSFNFFDLKQGATVFVFASVAVGIDVTVI